jgi:hypothetical protein
MGHHGARDRGALGGAPLTPNRERTSTNGSHQDIPLAPLGISLIVTLLFAAPSTGTAMDFRLAERTIYATGAIKKGDADKLDRLVRDNKLASGDEWYTVRLNSPGGLLLEAMKIGTIIRDAALETLISHDAECASACALAFLGGTRRYATGVGIERRMEFGAALGFHGFSPPTDSFRLESETLNVSRVINGLILEYAAQMKRVDLGWLAKTLSVAPDQLHYVKSPADIAALSIDLLGIPSAVPRDWYLNACRLVVGGVVPALDGYPTPRVSSHVTVIPTIRALRAALVAGRFEASPTATFAETLSDSDAIDLALGQAFYLDMKKPILDAQSVDLQRGAGFYYDKCIAVRSRRDVSVILVDLGGHDLLRKDFGEYGRINFRLAMFDEKAPLW